MGLRGVSADGGGAGGVGTMAGAGGAALGAGCWGCGSAGRGGSGSSVTGRCGAGRSSARCWGSELLGSGASSETSTAFRGTTVMAPSSLPGGFSVLSVSSRSKSSPSISKAKLMPSVRRPAPVRSRSTKGWAGEGFS